MPTIEQIKQLREETGVSFTECQKALRETNGDIDKAKEVLRKMGREVAGKRMEKETKAGIINTYLHQNEKVGVMIEIRCESDFVAKSEDFKKLSHNLCLQIAAMSPLFLSEDDIPEEFISGEKEIYQEQIKDSGKPKKIVDEIIRGKLDKYKQKISLFSQPWIKDDTKTVKELLDEYVAKIGEKVVVKKFVRYEI